MSSPPPALLAPARRRLATLLLAGCAALQAGAEPPPVLVELFTAEGCSSCPPADAFLLELEAPSPGVIVLGEHVDYWNRLGWVDPFALRPFSARQTLYAARLHHGPIYTPELVVDGQAELVGSNRGLALRAIAEAATRPKARVDLAAAPGGLAIRIEGAGTEAPAEVYLAITESGLQSLPLRGENRGRELRHAAVVRKLVVLGRTQAGAFQAQAPLGLGPGWRREHLQAVVFVQEPGAGRILGAARIALAGVP